MTAGLVVLVATLLGGASAHAASPCERVRPLFAAAAAAPGVAPALVPGGFPAKVPRLEGGTLVQPHFLFGNKTSNSAAVDLDFIAVWADR